MPRLTRWGLSISVLVLASNSMMSAAPRLVLNASAIGPLYVTPGTNGPLQSVEASNAGDGTLNIATTTSASWLAASVGAQRACTTQPGNCLPISISLNTASLSNGSYTEYVTVTAPNAIDSPQQISVNVVVASVPGSVTLYVAPGGGTATVNVYPHSPVVGLVATQSGGSWLSFGLPNGGVTFGTPYPITVTSQPGQAPGAYSGTVTTSGSTFQPDNTTVNVTLNVTTSPIIAVNNHTVLLNGYTAGPKATAFISFSNQGQGTLNITGAAVTSANNILSVSVTSANAITITADPSLVTQSGLYPGTVSITSNAANNALVSIPVEFTASAAGVPNIYQGGIVNIATFLADPLAQGDIVSIFGDAFTSPGSSFVNPGNPPLATEMGNAQVLVNSVAAPLYFVSRQQINFQMPYEAAAGQLSTVQVVARGVAGNARSVPVTATAPRILVWPQSEVPGNYGVVVNSDNTLSLLPGAGLGPSRLSRPGDVIVIYCIGLGQTTPPAVTGAPASSNPVLSNAGVTVTFGNSTNQVQAQAVFAGLTPTAVGLYQVNVTIPSNAPIGNSVPLTLSLGNTNANVANIPIASN